MPEPCRHVGELSYFFQWPCSECAAEEHVAWVESVAAQLHAALIAAAAGEPVVWHVWPPPDEQELIDAAAAELGFAPWIARHEPYDPAQDGEPVDWAPLFETAPDADGYTAAPPLTMEQIYQVLDEFTPMLVCSPAMFERVRDAVKGSELAGRVRVREHAWLDGEQVYFVDPTALKLPDISGIFEADPDIFKPKWRCWTCLRAIYEPGHCVYCEAFRSACPPPPISFLGILGGLGI